MHAAGNNIKQAIETLLNTDAYPGELLAAAQELHALLCSVLEIDENQQTADVVEQTILPSGKAICPMDAGRCVTDMMRTSAYFRGLVAAVEEAQQRFPGTTLRILYAGSGPFASLMLPLLVRFGPKDLQCTLIDIHEYSLNACKTLHEKLGWSGYVEDYIQGDATKIEFDADFHVLVTETMLRALEKEPQVSITAHLGRFLHPQGLLVPQNVGVTAQMANPGNEYFVPPPGEESAAKPENFRKRRMIGKVMDLNLDTAAALPVSADGNEILVPLVDLKMPEDISDFPVLMLFTRIEVFGEYVLKDYDSGLTNPLPMELPPGCKSGDTLHFSYRISDDPRIVCRVTSA